MADFADVERLRLQNESLLRKLQEKQYELKHSIESCDDKPYLSQSSSQLRRGYVPARPASPPTKDNPQAVSFSTQHEKALSDSSLIASNKNSMQITSTPKQLPTRTLSRPSRQHISPTHRSRTEILDTAPQEHLSSLSDHLDVSHSSYMSRLGPRQDDGLSRKMPSRISAQKMLLKKSDPKRFTRGKQSAKTRKSPRNISTVSAPGEKSSQAIKLNSSRRNHRVLNESVQSLRRGVTPTRRRLQSAVTPEASPRQQRYNLRRPHTATPKFGSLRGPTRHSPEKITSRYQSEFLNSYYAQEDEENMKDIQIHSSRSVYPGRLLDDGNARSPRRRVLDTTPKPKSILLTPGNKSVKGKNSMHVSFRDSPNTSSASTRHNDPDSSSGHIQPLLGYDWIAGLLDMDGHVSERTEGYMADLQEFRRNNYEECVHKSLIEEHEAELNTTYQGNREPTTSEATGKTHKCIHNYTLNDRLFPVPLHGAETGDSLCALCNARRPTDSSTVSPSYIRVSVPRSTLRSPYQVRPHRRKSFDPTDSIGLSQHCLAGWENSLPSMMPAASNIDLKDSLGYTISQSQSLFMDREDITGQPARVRRPLVPSNETQQLLNRSRSLRLDLQKLERTGLSQSKTANTTQYPVL